MLLLCNSSVPEVPGTSGDERSRRELQPSTADQALYDRSSRRAPGDKATQMYIFIFNVGDSFFSRAALAVLAKRILLYVFVKISARNLRMKTREVLCYCFLYFA